MELQLNEIRPVIVSDVESWVLFEGQRGTTYCLGSIERDKYIQLDDKNIDAVKAVIKYFDGNYTIKEIEELLICEKQIKMDVGKLYDYLCKADLIENVEDKTKVEKQEMDYLSITLKDFNLKKMYPVFEYFNEKLFDKVLIISMIIILCAVGFFLKNISIFLNGSNYAVAGSFGLSIVISLFIFVVSIGVHEFAHGVVGYRCGLRPTKLVVALYLCTPMFYLKMPGIYTITPRKRVYVWIAGVYMNLLIASVCIIVASITGGFVKTILILFSITNISLVFSNLSPLLPLDGYFIMSTLLKRPNLRKGSFKEFRKWALGKDNSFRGISILYFICSAIFASAIIVTGVRWSMNTIMTGIQNNYSVIEIVLQFRVVLMLFSLILIKKLVEIVMKHFSINKIKKIQTLM